MTSNLSMLIPGPAEDSHFFRWAFVTQLSPLRIRLDGETVDLPFTPNTLASGLVVNDRVWVAFPTSQDPQYSSRRVIILGRGGGDLAQQMPPGVIVDFGGSSAPSGWALCNGGTLNRTTDAALFAVIGTTYGVGDGSTTFNVPDKRKRVAVGFDSTQAEFDTLGETGGEISHTLTQAEMPNHSHAQVVTAAVGGSGVRTDYNSDAASSAFDQGVNTGGVVGSTGGAHNNLQPYITFNSIIKK